LPPRDAREHRCPRAPPCGRDMFGCGGRTCQRQATVSLALLLVRAGVGSAPVEDRVSRRVTSCDTDEESRREPRVRIDARRGRTASLLPSFAFTFLFTVGWSAMDLKELRRSGDERERGRDWSGFVDACRAVADHPAAAGDAISYLQKAAVASEQHLRDPDGALAIWRRVAEIDPKNRYASAALRRLHLARGDWASALAVAREHGAVRDCVRLFERALEGREGRDRLELLIHLGRRHEEIGERSSAPRALRAYQQALEIAPGNPDAAAALARLYDPARDAAPLAAVLWTLVEQAGSDGEAIELLRRIAALATGPLGDPEQALTAQRAIVDRGGADVRALAGLVRQHQEQEDWAEVDRLRRQIAEALAAE